MRTTLERKRKHAEEDEIIQISMPCISSVLDKLEWSVVSHFIQGTFKTLPVALVVYRKVELHRSPSMQATEAVNPLAESQ